MRMYHIKLLLWKVLSSASQDITRTGGHVEKYFLSSFLHCLGNTLRLSRFDLRFNQFNSLGKCWTGVKNRKQNSLQAFYHQRHELCHFHLLVQTSAHGLRHASFKFHQYMFLCFAESESWSWGFCLMITDKEILLPPKLGYYRQLWPVYCGN